MWNLQGKATQIQSDPMATQGPEWEEGWEAGLKLEKEPRTVVDVKDGRVCVLNG